MLQFQSQIARQVIGEIKYLMTLNSLMVQNYASIPSPKC
jgi:hypothetical protein